MNSASLAKLSSVASLFAVTLEHEEPTQLAVSIDIPRPSGDIATFKLHIRDSGAGPIVYERELPRLPHSCLERHINSDGSFCLGWSSDGIREIADELAAKEFWSRLELFLDSQLAAEKTGRWPGQQNARAHGNAASYQHRAEQLASQLDLLDDLKRGNLHLRVDRRWRREHLEILRGSKKIARMVNGAHTLSTTQTICPCNGSKPAPVGDCGDHAKLLAELVSAIYNWKKTHAKFIESAIASGQKCCGTMERCELRPAPARGVDKL